MSSSSGNPRHTTSLSDIKGVGDKTWAQLQVAGLLTVGDLIEFLPRAYEDYSQVSTITELRPGNVVVRGKISAVTSRYVRRGLHITTAVLSDASGKVPMTWFNQPYRATHLKAGGDWLVAGEFTLSQRRYQIMNPSVRSSDEIIADGTAIVPIYRQVAGLKSRTIQKIIEEIRPIITMLPDHVPDILLKRFNLLSYAEAMVSLHFPESSAEIERGRQRIGFQEMLELLYAAELNRADNAVLESYAIPFDAEIARAFVSRLPFRLTNDQRRAAWDVIENFASGIPMNRLLQGDVGSGKTIVAGMAAYMASRAGYQSVIMAPTELLARQHAETLSALLEPVGVTVGLLVGSIKKKPKDELKEQIRSGAVAVTVGTHALIQHSVNFYRLGFVVIDEQHRFGVAQRQKLLSKGHLMPHLLTMTATPIPRSLQLTMYGDLDVSIIREKPAGRQPIITKIHSPISYKALFTHIDTHIEAGRQVYVVCPLIDNDPFVAKDMGTSASHGGVDGELQSVTAEFERLQKTAMKHRRIGLLHGKLPSAEKEAVMRRFVDHEIDVLVSTTVIEVGVDVPNATIMVIEGAERFGLAQLHQLRGRVGRGDHQSYCYLVPTEAKQTTSLRLRELERSNDGFYLAEKDLELRGPGEIYGQMQHGDLNLQIARITDMELVASVRRAITWARENDVDLLQYESMRQRVERYRRLTTLN